MNEKWRTTSNGGAGDLVVVRTGQRPPFPPEGKKWRGDFPSEKKGTALPYQIHCLFVPRSEHYSLQ